MFFQLPVHKFQQCFLEKFKLRMFDHFPGEPLGQDLAGFPLADPARPQIKKRVFLKLPDRRSVAAFHVIGKDLQLRLGVSLGRIRKEQALVRLMSVRPLRVLAHHNYPAENAAGIPRQESLEKLVALPVRLAVIHECLLVQDLVLVPEIKSVKRAGSAFSIQCHTGVIARQTPSG